MKRLTRRQQEVLDFIQQWIHEKQYPPSVREIATRFGLRSASGVHKHVKALVRKNFIVKDDFLSRSIRVVGNAPAGPPGTPGEAPPQALPVTGTLAAQGKLMPLEPGHPAALPLGAIGAGTRAGHALRIGDKQLATQGLQEGDYALIQPASAAKDGQVVLVTVRGTETRIRRFRREGLNAVALDWPGSPELPLMLPGADVQVLGIVTGVWRPFA